MAAENGHAKIVEILIQNKANARARNKSGQTPLQLAEQYGNVGNE